MRCKNAGLEHRKILGRGIRQWRQFLKLSQPECAGRLQISVRYLQMLENGLRMPSGPFLMRLAMTTPQG